MTSETVKSQPVGLGLIVLYLAATFSCQSPQHEAEETFRPQLVALWTDSLETTMAWYKRHLGFEIEKRPTNYPDYNLRIAFIKRENFHFELLEKTPSYHQSEVLSNDNVQMGGITKLGFVVDNLEETFNSLKKTEEVDFITEIQPLPETDIGINWPKRYFLIRDVDGNYLQFFTFDDGSKSPNDPWLVMITVRDMEQAIRWYSMNAGFTLLTKVGSPGNRRAILSRNNRMLELFEPEEILLRKSLSSDSTVIGFTKIGYGLNNFNPLYENLKSNNAQIAFEPDSSDTDWAWRAMIAYDHEGNWVQFFELKE